mmetsp:Transcript_672/g.1573  ORF Transcript_672/g.1573 Transcript_672/m.1573 type:complete len:274 (+) Transcript_672:342-1163(+)
MMMMMILAISVTSTPHHRWTRLHHKGKQRHPNNPPRMMTTLETLVTSVKHPQHNQIAQKVQRKELWRNLRNSHQLRILYWINGSPSSQKFLEKVQQTDLMLMTKLSSSRRDWMIYCPPFLVKTKPWKGHYGQGHSLTLVLLLVIQRRGQNDKQSWTRGHSIHTFTLVQRSSSTTCKGPTRNPTCESNRAKLYQQGQNCLETIVAKGVLQAREVLADRSMVRLQVCLRHQERMPMVSKAISLILVLRECAHVGVYCHGFDLSCSSLRSQLCICF